MAKTYQVELRTYSQADFDKIAHSLIFASEIVPVAVATPSAIGKSIIVTSNVDSENYGADYELLANDSQSEVSVDISTGKFVEGNLIAFVGTIAEAQADLRDFVTYFQNSGDQHLHIGVCNTTQSQDYTPDLLTNNRVLKMMSPAQVSALNLG